MYADDLVWPWWDALRAEGPLFDVHTHVGTHDPSGFSATVGQLKAALSSVDAGAMTGRPALEDRQSCFPEPGSCILPCRGTLTRSGVTRAAAAIALVANDPPTTFCSPFINASKPCRATSAGSSFLPAPTFVSSMPARSKNSVSVGPGSRVVTVTPLSCSSTRRASANDVMNALDAEYTAL